ncbi:tyrosine-type recombinase/integrase [Microtetraspora sp. NBRC 13810]|uniref:tyrosine-type recombinase/integrase n=1 Tax=Microtetraspora sp. NBRC 13810 TaxID=3030990 RepID=UPI0033191643
MVVLARPGVVRAAPALPGTTRIRLPSAPPPCCDRVSGEGLYLHSTHRASRRTHDLRHSTATLLLEQGIDLVVIKELLGHAHIGVTAGVYAHVRLRLQRQAIDSLGEALSPGSDGPDLPPVVR